MKENVYIHNWSLAWLPNNEITANGIVLKTPADVLNGGYRTIPATVPGNFELDFMREGLLDDVYMGANSVKTQVLENLHFYYFTEFEYTKKDGFDSLLCFEGIDTVAEIYLDGEKIAFVENMLHAHRFPIDSLAEGKHTLLVHILPCCIYARQYDIPAMCYGMKYNHDGVELRKPGSMFGWDIMPRLVSAGLWKPVSVEYLSKTRICNPFTYTCYLNEQEAVLTTTLKIHTNDDFITDYQIQIKGKCGNSEFYQEFNPYCAHVRFDFAVKNPKLWWPKNYGEQNLYDIEIKLLKKGEVCDVASYRIGIRYLWLKRTSRSGDNGEFCFIVNGKKIFVMGTNWVPCDAFPSRHDEYTLRNLELANDIGCNMIRCWGGNVYPSELFYNYCDEHGIMIWQDFALACGHYPDDERLCKLVKEEVKQLAIEKRNHPALAVWAGDNECDCFVSNGWETHRTDDEPLPMLNPNHNVLTRSVILQELRNHDATRPYLPSSPYLDDEAYRFGMPAESHIWGPRDYFKGNYYGTTECHFASEIGYHGCPSPKSLEKFIPKESMPKNSIYDICPNPDWLIHAAGIEPVVNGNPYAYRLPLMISQVERLFTKASDDLSTFARQSQVSQAEAVKFFIEMFRCQKWRKTGILWWNVADGWPQVSDAVVDWYGCKKLAYHYIKRSQQAFCLMCAEPKNHLLDLLAANDTQADVSGEYSVIDLTTDEQVASGSFALKANESAVIAQLPEKKNGFYLIRWISTAGKGQNHFTCTIGDDWTWENYEACLKKAGFYDEFEGF